MTRKVLLTSVVAGVILLAPGVLDSAAEAGVHWSFGTGFSVGGLDFNVVVGQPFGYPPEEFFYRTHRGLHYAGYSCHAACAFRDGYYYHHRNCPLVRHHFRSYGYVPRVDWWISSRPYDHGWRSLAPHRSYRYRYDRHRYDRYRHDRSRYDRHRYDRHPYDRHRRDWRPYRDDHRERDSGRYDRRRPDRNRGGFDRERGHRHDRRRGSATRSPRRQGG